MRNGNRPRVCRFRLFTPSAITMERQPNSELLDA
jgi:hypothetical protein